jgi:hypothetical protein
MRGTGSRCRDSWGELHRPPRSLATARGTRLGRHARYSAAKLPPKGSARPMLNRKTGKAFTFRGGSKTAEVKLDTWDGAVRAAAAGAIGVRETPPFVDRVLANLRVRSLAAQERHVFRGAVAVAVFRRVIRHLVAANEPRVEFVLAVLGRVRCGTLAEHHHLVLADRRRRGSGHIEVPASSSIVVRKRLLACWRWFRVAAACHKEQQANQSLHPSLLIVTASYRRTTISIPTSCAAYRGNTWHCPYCTLHHHRLPPGRVPPSERLEYSASGDTVQRTVIVTSGVSVVRRPKIATRSVL